MTEWRELLWTNILCFSNNFFLMMESEKKWWFWGAGMGEVAAGRGNSCFAFRYPGKDRWWQLLRAECFNLSFSSSCQRGKSKSETAGNCSPRFCQPLAQESGKSPRWKEHSVYTEPSLHMGGNPKCKPMSQNAEELPLFSSRV